MNDMKGSHHQKGVALIMAMMIVALVAVVAVEISWRFELSMSRNSNRWYGMQAAAYLQGAEQLAMVVLQEDLQGDETKEADHMNEVWAQEAMPFPTDHGWVKGQIEDAQGRFNINLMLPGGPSETHCPDGTERKKEQPNDGCLVGTDCDKFTPAQIVFIRFLQALNLGTDDEPIRIEFEQAKEITDAIVDWIDQDSNVRGFGGAESAHYESLDVPISIANQEMVSVSELQVVRGITPELYNMLVNYVIALPRDKASKININTASLPLLQAVKRKYVASDNSTCDMQPFSYEDGSEIFSFMRGADHVKWTEMASDGGVPFAWKDSQDNLVLDESLFGLGPSNYFLLKSEVGIGEDFVRRGQSLIYRDDGTKNTNTQSGNKISVEVVRRSDANF